LNSFGKILEFYQQMLEIQQNLENDEQKALFANAKVGDAIIFNPHTAYNGHEPEIASLLEIESKKRVAGIKSDFKFQITEINRYVPAEINQELFDRVFENGDVTSEEQFRANLKTSIADNYTFSSRRKFGADVRNKLLEKIGKDLTFSETLLKRLMKLNAEEHKEEVSDEFINQNYDKAVEGLKWKLIKEQLVKKYDIQVDDSTLLDAAKDAARIQFAKYGADLPLDFIGNYAGRMLEEEGVVNRLTERAIEDKLMSVLRDQMKVNYKTVSLEEFGKLFA
jgi:trigger factor